MDGCPAPLRVGQPTLADGLGVDADVKPLRGLVGCGGPFVLAGGVEQDKALPVQVPACEVGEWKDAVTALHFMRHA